METADRPPSADRPGAGDAGPDMADLRGAPPPPPTGRDCVRHAGVTAEAVCSDCGRPVCADCVSVRGGGHAFCRECVEASRLVDAPAMRPPSEDAPGAGSPGAGDRTVLVAVLVAAGVVALLALAFAAALLLAVVAG